MNKPMVVFALVAVVIGGIIIFNINKKNNPADSGLSNREPTTQTIDIFTDKTDLCSIISKEQMSNLIGKPITKTESHASGTLQSCQYYLNDTQAITLRHDVLNLEKQKKGHQVLGRTISTSPSIPSEHFIVTQDNGVINEIYLVISGDEYLSFDRSSTKTLSEEETVSLAAKLSNIITGKNPMQNAAPVSPTTASQGTVPLPLDTDIVRSFFNYIDGKQPNYAVNTMTVEDEAERQAWAVQFNAIDSVKLVNIEPANQSEWTDTKHEFKVTLDVRMKPDSANAPIPYYGWENSRNIRWITMEKVGKMWKVQSLATGP